jgi:site-specific recombinase XerD
MKQPEMFPEVATGMSDERIGLERFRVYLQGKDWSEASVASYVANVRQFAVWYGDVYGVQCKLSDVVQREIQEHRAWMQQQSSAAETINRRLVSLRAYFDWLGVTPNPAAAVKGIAIVDMGVQAISTLELRRLLREVHRGRNVRDIAILEMLCHTGVRVSELTGARMGDIEMTKRRGVIRVRSGKGCVARDVPLNADVREALSAWIDSRNATWQGDWLFVGQRGKLGTSAVWRIVRKYGDLAGIQDLHVHQLRHTVLTRLVREQGIDLATVARISGHRNLKTLLRYTAATQEDVERAMESLEFTGDSG